MSAILHSIITSIENSRHTEHLQSWKKNMEEDLEMKKQIKILKIRKICEDKEKFKKKLLKKFAKLLNNRKEFMQTSQRKIYGTYELFEIDFPFYTYCNDDNYPIEDWSRIQEEGFEDLLDFCLRGGEGSPEYCSGDFEDFRKIFLEDVEKYFDKLTTEDLYCSLYNELVVGETVMSIHGLKKIKPRDDIYLNISVNHVVRTSHFNDDKISLDNF